ncbi:Uncharacterized protein Rs2_30541 [Raphanus sativus]|nr:Uncharacterized protein Rs2_30541 [Raphanus sativus]
MDVAHPPWRCCFSGFGKPEIMGIYMLLLDSKATLMPVNRLPTYQRHLKGWMWRLRLWIRIRVVSRGLIRLAWRALVPESYRDERRMVETGVLCYIDSEELINLVRLEAVLLAHPEIANAPVIVIPDNKAGQYPMEYIVRTAGNNLSESGIMSLVAKQGFSTMQTMFITNPVVVPYIILSFVWIT